MRGKCKGEVEIGTAFGLNGFASFEKRASNVPFPFVLSMNERNGTLSWLLYLVMQ